MMVQAAGRAEDMMGKYQKRSSGRTELKKAWLNRARKLNEERGNEFLRLREFEDAAYKITVNYSPSAGGGSKNPRKIEPYAVSSAFLKNSNKEVKKLQKEILKAISTLRDADQVQVCILRYVELCEWKEIADKMKYSRRHVFRIHDEAIKNIKIPSAVCNKPKQKNEQIIKS